MGRPQVGTIVAGLGVVDEGVVIDAVLTGVVAFIDVTVFLAEFEEPLHGADVAQVGGADEFIGRNAEFVPESAPGVGHFGDEFGFRDAGFFGGAFDVDAVLIGAGGHDNVVAAHTLEASNGVADDRRVGVTNVRQAVGVVDRRGQIIFFFSFGHLVSSLVEPGAAGSGQAPVVSFHLRVASAMTSAKGTFFSSASLRQSSNSGEAWRI